VGKENLARVSPTPGFTNLLNFFTINNEWRLVDLPGYGFADLAKKHSAKFNRAVLNFLEHRTNLCSVFALIDSTLPPQEIDIEFIEWLTQRAVPFILVFTKIDKVPATTVQANIAAFMEKIGQWYKVPPTTFTSSAETIAGRQELLGVIDEAMTAIRAEQRNLPQEAPKPNKRRPDRQRPW
jgi:GTP-binding protein